MSAAEDFEEFVTIVEEGNLTAAARKLEMPRPTLSRRLGRLEERLGSLLLHRTTRRMQLTPVGEALYEKARRIVIAAREAEAAVTRHDGVPRGLLRISVPGRVPEEQFARLLSDFMALHPGVRVELIATNEDLDLVTHGIDLALRRAPEENSSLMTRTVVRNQTIVVASPEYLKCHPDIRTPEDLAAHNCITGYRADTTPEHHWPLLAGGTIEISGSLITNDMGVRLAMAKNHQGLAVITDDLARRELNEGTLVRVLPETIGRDDRISLIYPNRAYLEPKVRVFIDFLVDRLQLMRAQARGEPAPETRAK